MPIIPDNSVKDHVDGLSAVDWMTLWVPACFDRRSTHSISCHSRPHACLPVSLLSDPERFSDPCLGGLYRSSEDPGTRPHCLPSRDIVNHTAGRAYRWRCARSVFAADINSSRQVSSASTADYHNQNICRGRMERWQHAIHRIDEAKKLPFLSENWHSEKDLCIRTALKFASSSECLITNVAIPAHFLAVDLPDWRNGTISSPDLYKMYTMLNQRRKRWPTL